MTSINAALADARGRIPVSEAKLLLRQALGCSAAFIEAHGDDDLPAATAACYSEWLRRRSAGEPVAYLLGKREFYGREYLVTPDVLIPRPETELLVELAIARLKRHCNVPRILDMGTGSGCVATSLALELPSAEVMALDVSLPALQVAQNNALRLGANIRCIHSDWFSALTGECYDLIVANPPYVALDDAHLGRGDLRFEPQLALASGADGLAAIRCIVSGARRHLLPGGWLLLEHGHDQAEAVRTLLEDAGLAEIGQHRDLAGIIRVTGGSVLG